MGKFIKIILAIIVLAIIFIVLGYAIFVWENSLPNNQGEEILTHYPQEV